MSSDPNTLKSELPNTLRMAKLTLSYYQLRIHMSPITPGDLLRTMKHDVAELEKAGITEDSK